MPTRPLVAVCLGTDHHPFNRLITWIDQFSNDSPWDWYIQHGHTILPATLSGASLMSVGGLHGLLKRADAVVTHGGPGLIMEARAAGHVPIVVPRNPELGEHVDGHQQRFVAHIADSGLITSVATRNQLRTAISRALTTDGAVPPDGDPGASAVRRFGDLVENLVHSNVIHQR